MVQEERKRLLQIESHLHQRVIGQEEAITAVAEAVRRSRTGMKDPNRPIGSFIFLGPTGVGKTELAKALAEYLFNDQDAMIRFDMSEYQEKHTVSRLVGAPPGYVGYEEAGQLTEALRRKPYSVVLFDEIEKAHPDVFNILLQMMDDGRLTDSKGKTVDCKNTVIIMTSNVGAHRIFELEEQGRDWESIKSAAMEALKAQFRPEFINRVDEIVVFHPLTKDEIGRIVDLMLEHTRRKVHAQKLAIDFSDAAKAAIAEKGFDPTYGARPLRRAIQKEIETPISRLLLEEEFQEGDRIRVDYADGRFTFFREERPSEKPAAATGPAAELGGA
jgi:ATP-dependent Clp protease ATP-binding subunit ClpC